MKLVRENIEFKRGQSTTKALGVGLDAYMKDVKQQLKQDLSGMLSLGRIDFWQYRTARVVEPPIMEISVPVMYNKNLIQKYKDIIEQWFENNTDLQIKTVPNTRHPHLPPRKSIHYRKRESRFKITFEPIS